MTGRELSHPARGGRVDGSLRRNFPRCRTGETAGLRERQSRGSDCGQLQTMGRAAGFWLKYCLLTCTEASFRRQLPGTRTAYTLA